MSRRIEGGRFVGSDEVQLVPEVGINQRERSMRVTALGYAIPLGRTWRKATRLRVRFQSTHRELHQVPAGRTLHVNTYTSANAVTLSHEYTVLISPAESSQVAV